jgi:N-methylhydantoinase B
MVGWGATDERDGNCVTSAITNGDTFNYSIELLEAKFPVRVKQYALNTPGGVGAGLHRGGYGSIREYEILADDAVLSASYGRSIEKPWAASGGAEGSCNYFELQVGNDAQRAARAPTTIMKQGDIIRMFTGGGGGYGDPFDRPAYEVLEEVRAEYITPAQAREDYGVVIATDGRSVDAPSTNKLRTGFGA